MIRGGFEGCAPYLCTSLLADALGKPLIPLLLEENMQWPPKGLGMFLSGYVYLKFVRKQKNRKEFWTDNAMDQLLKQIREHTKPFQIDEEIIENTGNLNIAGTGNNIIQTKTWSYTGEVSKLWNGTWKRYKEVDFW